MRGVLRDYDVLALPVSQVPPFRADQEYPATINGEPQETYLDWMRSSYLITVTGCPAISVPAGFTPRGLAGRPPAGRPRPAASGGCSRSRTRSSRPPAVGRPATRRSESASMTRRIRIGIDTGGTFTDVVAVDEETGELATTKTPSTPADPAVGFMAGVDKVLGAARALAGDAVTRGQPRHDRRHQQAARGQGREPRLHHHRGLRARARDRPAVGARRLRQLLLLGEADRDRARRPGQDGRRPAGRRRRGDPAVRRGVGARRGGPVLPRPRASARSACASCTRTPIPTPRARDARRARTTSTPTPWCRSRSEVLREYREYERSVTTLVDAAVKPEHPRATSPTHRTRRGLDGATPSASSPPASRRSDARST